MESFLTHAGYLALILFGVVESCSIPISSEITFGFAGVLAYQGHLNLALVIVIGSAAEMAGSLLSYWIGRLGGRPAVDRFGKYVLLTHRDLDRAERFFAGRGAWAVTIGRLLPVLRRAWWIKWTWRRTARRFGLVQTERSRPPWWSSRRWC